MCKDQVGKNVKRKRSNYEKIEVNLAFSRQVDLQLLLGLMRLLLMKESVPVLLLLLLLLLLTMMTMMMMMMMEKEMLLISHLE